MRKQPVVLSTCGVVVISAIGLIAWAQNAQDGPLTLDKLPAAVRATVQKETAGGEIKEIEVETHNGKTVYEVDFIRDGKKHEITISADGTLMSNSGDDDDPKPEEQERPVKEGEVPAAALAALKKLAGDAKISEFSEEIEHGAKFYEGSWKTGGGNVDALVSVTGDLVELEEEIKSDRLPAAVLAAVSKLAGADCALFCEKKTMILYEVKFRKGEERHEILYTPDAREQEHEVKKGNLDDKD
ncbi:MAG: hypothetical protein JNG88_01790 [Phycisphaerales bacterium]|nr:hypothetical protein [Phycisphaerales bacterium]